jgi:hypothetical protein
LYSDKYGIGIQDIQSVFFSLGAFPVFHPGNRAIRSNLLPWRAKVFPLLSLARPAMRAFSSP